MKAGVPTHRGTRQHKVTKELNEAGPLLIVFTKAVWRGILAWKSTCSAAFSREGMDLSDESAKSGLERWKAPASLNKTCESELRVGASRP